MPALKDIAGIAPVLAGTALARSPLWSMPVDQIVPAQLTAFRTKQRLVGCKNQADAAIDFALRQVANALQEPDIAMLGYSEPHDRRMTSSELVRGFEQMRHPMPAAILFGLETYLAPDELVSLTWEKANKMLREGRVNNYARHILKSQVLSISSRYVFWWDSGRKHMPLFGLEKEVFDIFGCVWGELSILYQNIILE